jgi:hypothetical protein
MKFKKLLFWNTVLRKFRRWRTDRWFDQLRKNLYRMDAKLKNAEYSRHERRRILRMLISDIEGSLSTWLSKEED